VLTKEKVTMMKINDNYIALITVHRLSIAKLYSADLSQQE